MEDAPAPETPLSPQELADAELTRVYFSDASNEAAREEFARRCVKKIEIMIRGLVFKKGICPPSQARDVFAEDASSLAQLKFWKGIRKLRFPERLNGWLKAVARSAVLEQVDKVTGTIDPPPQFETLESLEEIGSGGNLGPPELEKRERIDERYYDFGSTYWQHPGLLVADRELSEIVVAALCIHAQRSKRDADSALWIEKKLLEDPPAAEIAKERGTSERDVWRLFRHDHEELRCILTDNFRLRPLDFI